MPRQSPLHPRISQACLTYRFKTWNGYVAACQYGPSFEREYLAFRHGAALMDVSPLCKYELRGAEAGAFLSRLTVRDLTRLSVGRVAYVCWCDGEGQVLDDGTCHRLAEDRYRLTSAAPALHWLERQADGFDVTVRDVSDELAALALQGPRSRAVLARIVGEEMAAGLRHFRGSSARLGSAEGWVTRTGYTGDLGYELWLDAAEAPSLWDRLLDEGAALGLAPAGLDALDVVRIEAGLFMRDVDYRGARDTLAASWRMTPFELGLGWMVDLERDPPFVGQTALREMKERSRALVGLVLDPQGIEALFEQAGIPVDLPHGAWRDPVPVHVEGRQIGRASSGTFSPLLKESLALATIDARLAEPGTTVFVEQTVDVTRRPVRAVVRSLPFYEPEHRKS
jgi:aminomethyltransferase